VNGSSTIGYRNPDVVSKLGMEAFRKELGVVGGRISCVRTAWDMETTHKTVSSCWQE